jgi:lysophospholipid acyltransferase (LPLAT)-like uncharacterized protein
MSSAPPVPLTARLVGFFGAFVLRLIGCTWRLQIRGYANFERLQQSGQGILFALWHEAILPLTFAMRGKGHWMLVSQHRDGEYITQVLHQLGYQTVRGSTTRGGYRSLLEMAKRGKAGEVLGITPDGPKGPRREVQGGVLLIAQRAGIPILPIMAAAAPCKRLASWDRFMIPHPFARVVIHIGEPILIPGELKPDQLFDLWREPVTKAIGSVTNAAEGEVAP